MTTPQGSRTSADPRLRRSTSERRPEWQDSVTVEKRALPSLSPKKMSERTQTLKKIYGNASTNVSLPPIQRSSANSRAGTFNGRISQSRTVHNIPSAASGSSRASAQHPREQALHELLNVVGFLKTNCKQLKRENEYLNTQVRQMKQSQATDQATTEAFHKKHKNFEKEWNRQVLEFSQLKETFTQQTQSLEERDKEIRSLRIDGLRSRINELQAIVGRGIAESSRLNASIVNVNSPHQDDSIDYHLTFTKEIASHKMQQLTDLLAECESRIRVLSKEAQMIIKDVDSDDDVKNSLSKLLDKLTAEHSNFEKQCDHIMRNIDRIDVNDRPLDQREETVRKYSTADQINSKGEDKEDDDVAADFMVLLQTHRKRLQILKTLDDAKEHELVQRNFEKRGSESLSSPEK